MSRGLRLDVSAELKRSLWRIHGVRETLGSVSSTSALPHYLLSGPGELLRSRRDRTVTVRGDTVISEVGEWVIDSI